MQTWATHVPEEESELLDSMVTYLHSRGIIEKPTRYALVREALRIIRENTFALMRQEPSTQTQAPRARRM